jgi:hypothetical protein
MSKPPKARKVPLKVTQHGNFEMIPGDTPVEQAVERATGNIRKAKKPKTAKQTHLEMRATAKALSPKPRKPKPAKKPHGRPSLWSPAMGERICEELVTLRSLLKVCDQEGMPKLTTVYDWEDQGEADIEAGNPQTEKAKFFVDFARAKKRQAKAIVEEALDISDDGRNDWMEKESERGSYVVLNHEHVQRSKLRVDTRMAVAARLNPALFAPMQKLADAEGKKLPPLPAPLMINIQGNGHGDAHTG